jgi:ribosomal protein L16 Arg81 hydroxylase
MEFANALHPFLLDDFIRTHWAQRPLWIGGDESKFSGLYDFSDLRGGLMGDVTPARGRRAPLGVKVGYADGEAQGHIGTVPLQEAMSLFDAGMSLCVTRVDAASPKLAALVASVRKQMQFKGEVEINCYYSPDHAGFSWHFDCQHVFILQIDGKKRWEYTPYTGIDWPPFNVTPKLARSPEGQSMSQALGVEIRLPEKEDVLSQVLSPGDVLYLPPGTWHRASALGHSMALTLTLYPLSPVRLLRTLLTVMAVREVSWRRDIQACDLLQHEERMASCLEGFLQSVKACLDQTSGEALLGLHSNPRLYQLAQIVDSRLM